MKKKKSSTRNQKSAVKARKVSKPKVRAKATAKSKALAKPKVPGKAKAKAVAKTQSTSADWREATLNQVRKLIQQADPNIVEEPKWRKPSNGMKGVPVWSHHGIVCTGETYKSAVKLTFMNGASLPDPARLFNASLEGGTRRAIDIREGEQLDAQAFKALINVAVAHNALAKKH
jgi:hypothetical protein